jgi:deoxycytidylate deaminase
MARPNAVCWRLGRAGLYGMDAHLDVFEREIMADVAALPVDADHAEGLEIRAQVREEMAAIAQLLRDGLRAVSQFEFPTTLPCLTGQA